MSVVCPILPLPPSTNPPQSTTSPRKKKSISKRATQRSVSLQPQPAPPLSQPHPTTKKQTPKNHLTISSPSNNRTRERKRHAKPQRAIISHKRTPSSPLLQRPTRRTKRSKTKHNKFQARGRRASYRSLERARSGSCSLEPARHVASRRTSVEFLNRVCALIICLRCARKTGVGERAEGSCDSGCVLSSSLQRARCCKDNPRLPRCRARPRAQGNRVCDSWGCA